MSSDHETNDGEVLLSSQLTSVFEKALEKLKVDSDEKFFPDGVGEICVRLSGDPPGGELRVSARARPPLEQIIGCPSFWIRPMYVFPAATNPGQGVTLDVQVGTTAQKLCFPNGQWSVVDLDDPSGNWTVVPSPFVPPHTVPTGRKFWIWVAPDATGGVQPVRIGNIPIAESQWFLEDPVHPALSASTPWPDPTAPQPKPKI